MHKKLFIVDDDPANTRLYERLLRPMLETIGIEVRIFDDASSVLEAVAQSGLPDALVTDDQMPNMSGRDLASTLRASGFTGKILMISGTADEAVYAYGVNELLEKPVNSATLRNSVRAIIG